LTSERGGGGVRKALEGARRRRRGAAAARDGGAAAAAAEPACGPRRPARPVCAAGRAFPARARARHHAQAGVLGKNHIAEAVAAELAVQLGVQLPRAVALVDAKQPSQRGGEPA